MTLCTLQASNTQRPLCCVCIPVSEALTFVSGAQSSPQQAFCLCVDSLLQAAAELLCLNNPAASCWYFHVVSFPSSGVEPGKLYLKRGGKEGSLHSICCRVCPSTCTVWPSPCQPWSCLALIKEGFPPFYRKTEKYVLSSSGENVTPLKFPAFLCCLYSVLGGDWGNLRWPRRENSRDLCLNCLNS